MSNYLEIKDMSRPSTTYEKYMQEQEVPIIGGIGVYDTRELPLGPWRRLGGKGAFLDLEGIQEGGVGIYVVEIPPGGALNPEHHLYEEMLLVIEGRGSTEVWKEGSTEKQTFEWQRGSFFAIPLNTWHRLVNATSSPALLIGATNAPQIMNIFHNLAFVFNDTFDFSDRYDGRDDYFKGNMELSPDPTGKRYALYTNLIPDVINCELPADGYRVPGSRRFQYEMAENTLVGHMTDYPSGRYSRAHYHSSGAVLICLRGKGYTITWPTVLGTRPWEAGKGHLVKRQDYVPGGLVSAAPGSGDWFHAHFSVAKEPMRVLAVRFGSYKYRVGGAGVNDEGAPLLHVDLDKGGRSIPYRDEDPRIREDYKAALQTEGAEFQMPESLYI